MDEKLSKERVIFVSENNDKSTDNVIEWICKLNHSFIRKNVDLDLQEFKISISNKKVSTTFSNTVLWNRRGYLPIIPYSLKSSYWIHYLKKEQLPVLFSFEMINKSNYIGSYKQEFANNKILNLIESLKVGFEIPNTIVTNNKNDLFKFIESGKRYITKSIYQTPSIETTECIYNGEGTFELDLDQINEVFAPSLVQEYIEKDIEIRVFFIEDSFYSMAIFSQNDEKTKIDFRNYNRENPNRNVPFILPEEVLKKIKKFIKKIECNTGSIDLILTPNGNYVFLEINPMGQYDWVSQNCNYYIDKEIAEILVKKSNNGKRNKKVAST